MHKKPERTRDTYWSIQRITEPEGNLSKSPEWGHKCQCLQERSVGGNVQVCGSQDHGPVTGSCAWGAQMSSSPSCWLIVYLCTDQFMFSQKTTEQINTRQTKQNVSAKTALFHRLMVCHLQSRRSVAHITHFPDINPLARILVALFSLAILRSLIK